VTAVHLVVPEGIEDAVRPSGGNMYDRHICRALVSLGWAVHTHAVPGGWPRPGRAALGALAGVVGQIPDGAIVLLDGLVASAAPEALVAQAHRLRLVVLVHMPLGHRPPHNRADGIRRRERAVLGAADEVVATSAWSRRRLLGLYRLPAHRVHVVAPGVEPAGLATGTPAGGALLCVASLTSEKGHDVLLDALETLEDLDWRCACVGSLDRDPAFAEHLRHRLRRSRVGDRVDIAGPRTGDDLDRAYAAADLVVLASRAETYGMVVTEGLARGLPVVATEVGGVPEALGRGRDGARPGLLIPHDDAAALAAALRDWLGDAGLRERLRGIARERRETLSGWSTTARRLAGVLNGVAS
jgi:glycosyltransferase involved in cell wall biosynthesis